MIDPNPVHLGTATGSTGSATSNKDRTLIAAVALLSVPLAAAAGVAGGGRDWALWQWLVVLALAADLGGGMVAHMLPGIRNTYPARPRAPLRSLGFAALHLHLPVMALMLPGAFPMQAAWLGYIWMMGGAVLLLEIPARLRLAAALALSAIGAVLLSRLVPLDSALGWMPLLLFLKILAGHMANPARA